MGTAPQAEPKGASIEALIVSDGLAAGEEVMVSLEPDALVVSSEPQAARVRGRASARAATVIRVVRIGGAPCGRGSFFVHG